MPVERILTKLLILILIHVGCAEKIFTQQLTPIITGVTPSYGGVEGGTQITITGTNFDSTPLFTETAVFIGNERCEVIGHYTTSERIVCVTPKCFSDTCLSSNWWSGTSQMELSVYVTTVEGILSAFSSFVYYNYWTPSVLSMSSTTWGSATSSIYAIPRARELNDLGITIGGHNADLGDDGEFNEELFNYYDGWTTFYYRTPNDLPGGFYNLTFSVQDDLTSGSSGTGIARMFDRDEYQSWAYHHFYMFQSTPAGVSYTLCVFPSVASVHPSFGSMAGGQTLTISGSGFSNFPGDLEVYVGGQPCVVQTSYVDRITCITSARYDESDAAIAYAEYNNGSAISSHRDSGSPGWWIKMWSYYANPVTDTPSLEYGHKDAMYLSFYDHYGSDWDEQLDFSTYNLRYTHDAGTIFTAPYAGHYTFYIATDDNGYLYGSSEGVGVNEILLCDDPTYTPGGGDFFHKPGHQSSDPVPLAMGERLYLRFRNINSGGHDFSTIAVKISPKFDCEGHLDSAWMPSTSANESSCGGEVTDDVKVANFPVAVRQLNSFPETQAVELDIDLRRERQLINITRTTSGEYRLVVQGRAITSSLSMSSSASAIRSALYNAAVSISSSVRETHSFSVWINKGSDFLEVTVQFESDRREPYTMLQVYPVSLTGWNPVAVVSRIQAHSPFPSEGFRVFWGSEDSGAGALVPFDASPEVFEDTLETYLGNKDINVEVRRAGYSLSGYTWTVTFVIPRGNVPQLRVDTSTIAGPNSTATVTTLSNGSTTDLWYEPIPAWMAEVPVRWATAGELTSNVEVYRRTAAGDRVKAVCDNSGNAGKGFRGTAKGSEFDCAYDFSANATAIVSDYAINAFIDSYTVQIGVNGSGFLMDGTNSTVSVTIDGHTCNITVLLDDYIECRVSHVPWGRRGVAVHIPYFGYALRVTDKLLDFKPAVYSFEPSMGSVAGGQRITITGRGFRANTTVSMGSGNCDIKVMTSSVIECVTPAAFSRVVHNNAFDTNGDGNITDTESTVWDSLSNITVDGVIASGTYNYSLTSTPIVHSVSPTAISSAITTVVEIIGEGFESNTTVTVSDQQCLIQELYVDMIVCLLVRSGPKSAMETHVIIRVPGKGYASEASSLVETPLVKFGFELQSVSPSTGSVMGGTLLRLNGFGFLESNSSRHSVLMGDLDNPVTQRDQLLWDLGLLEDRPAALACKVQEVSFHHVTCLVPKFTEGQHSEHCEGHSGGQSSRYELTATLNELTATCAAREDCWYTQLNTSTPMIEFATVTAVNESSGFMTIELQGSDILHKPGRVSVFMNDKDCTVSSVSPSVITVNCPPVPAGGLLVEAYVEGYGWAHVMPTVALGDAVVVITDIRPHTPVGSIGGGTMVDIVGFGFSPNCSDNVMVLNITGDVLVQLDSDNFKECSVNHLSVVMPSIAAVYGSSFTVSSASTHAVREVYISSSDILSETHEMDFSYSASGTPEMSSTPSNGYVHDNITILLTAPSSGITESDIHVTFGSRHCHHYMFTQLTDVSFKIVCGGPELPGGVTYPVLVEMHPYGLALTSTGAVPTYTSNFQADNMAPSVFVSSVAGGSTLTLHGRGLSTDAYVTVCDNQCALQDATYSSVVCKTPARLTVRSVEYFDRIGSHIETAENLDATRFGSRTTSLGNLEDGNYNTYFYHDTVGCFLGLRLPSGFKARPYRLRFYPRLQYANLIQETVFEASDDGGVTYTVLDRITRAHEGWNYFEANATMRKKWFTHFRFRSADPTKNTRCMISELRVLGVVAAESSTCTVKVGSSATATLTTVGTVQYNGSAMTPHIASLSPRNGTALGGTLVTIRGHNLDALAIPMSDMPGSPMGVTLGGMDHTAEHTDMSHKITESVILFNGMCCMVNYSSANEIRCITTERDLDHIHHAETSVYIAGRGHAIANADATFMYIDRWSDLTTWRNQEPPVAGDLVWIPEGQVILLDVSTPVLTMVLIEGELYFDPTRDVNMDASYIYVNGGRLQVGTVGEPYLRNANITLHGDRYKTIELPHIGSKVLAVATKGMVHNHGGGSGMMMPTHMTGALEIHGAKRLRTWTKLSETAFVGSQFIVTSEPVDFKSGEKIVIAGSEIPTIEIFQDEEVTVISNDDGHTVYFSPPLRYTHRSEIVVVEGRTIDLRCEVGLLTRNVKIQGDDSSPGQMFGAHTIGMSGTFRIENVEVTRCGQAFNLGRYCTHSHHGGNFEGNYIKANSIHHSFQRAVTTHDTSYWEVRDNVAYDVMGHTYFVEDGTEFYNTFSGNLGIRTKTSSALLPSDTKPAVFWTTNPNNFWYDNVAAHSHSFGYWFELPSKPPGDDQVVCCHNEHLGQFSNNTARAHGSLGLRVYPRWTPHVDPCDTSSPPAPQYLYDTLSYRNAGNGMFAKKHGDLHHIGYTFLENAGIDISVFHYNHVGYTTDPTFLNTYIIDTLNENFTMDWNSGGLGVLAPQDEFFYMKDTTVVNYGTTPVLSGCNGCDSGEFMNQGAKTYRFEGLKFVNSSRRTMWSRHFKQIFWDLDGSLAGHENSYVLQWYDFNAWSPQCSRLPAAGYGNSMLCVNTTVRRVEIDFVKPNQVDFTDLRIFGDNRSSEVYFLPLDIYGWVAPLVTGHTYSLEWTDADVSPRQFDFKMGCREYIEEVVANGGNEFIGMRFSPKPYNYNPYSFNVNYDGIWKWSDINDTVVLSDHMAKSSFVNGTFDVILSSVGAALTLAEPFAVNVKAELCPPVGCPIPPLPSLPANYSLWSDPLSWPKKVVPIFEEDVVIEADMWIHMDVSPPPLFKLTVYGKLTFKNGLSSKLELAIGSLLVYGIVEVTGKDKAPFNGRAEIILKGGKQTSLPVTVGYDRFIGSKVLAVMGELTMVGQPTVETWVRLAEPAQAGATSAILRAPYLGWAVGDEIVFSPTGYYGKEGEIWSASSGSVEFRTITAITKMTGNVTKVTYGSPLRQTHFCGVVEEQSFCGAVGLVSRNVKVMSKDSENAQDSTNYGFGGHISVVDLVEELYLADRYFSGTVHLNSVELKNLGKVDSEYYAISFSYSGSHDSNVITNCSFNKGYNFALRASNTNGIIFRNNVALGNWGGGVYIEKTCKNFTVTNNMVVGVYQLPSVLKSLYPWTRPVAGFTIESVDGVVKHNLAAGSYDQGFAIATKYFYQPDRSQCAVTRGLPYKYNSATLVNRGKFSDNEAVGGKGGLMVMTMNGQESDPMDCLVVNGILAWRNAHSGIMAIGAEANIIVADVVLAENHIGVVLDYFKTSDRAFSGIVMSKIIGSMHSNGFSDLPDSKWDRRCQVFSAGDPFGLSSSCRSSIADIYHRVGVLVSQFTNRAKVCGAEGRFDQCQPPTTPDRLCAMPFDKRYALPHNFQYTEMHIHDTVFTGFRLNVTDKARSAAAVAFNPSQIDHQPNVIMSGLKWNGESAHRMDRDSRIAFSNPGRTVGCNSRPCQGFDIALIHDLDGSAGGYGRSGQLVMGNPGYAAPYPLCTTASELGAGVTHCPSTLNESSTTAYRQYSGVWRDFQSFNIGPIQVTKEFTTLAENRSYAAYAPVDDMCAMRMSFSRFPLHIAPGMKHKVVSTGTVPTTWYLRWDSPYATDSAVLEFFIHGSNAVRVFVGSDQAGPYREVPRFEDRYPTFSDRRGSSARNPQKRTLTVTVRGGTERWYKFVVVPVVAVNMKLEMDFDSFSTNNFIANIALLLNIPISRIKVAEVRRGSVIVDFFIEAATGNTTQSSNATITGNSTKFNSTAAVDLEIVGQVNELKDISRVFTDVVMSGALEHTLGVAIDTLTVVEPTIPQTIEDITNIESDDDYDFSGTFSNSTGDGPGGGSQTSGTNGNVKHLVSKPPTSYPTHQPTYSQAPSLVPTSVPSSIPSSPTAYPTAAAQTLLRLQGHAATMGVNSSFFDPDYAAAFKGGLASVLTSRTNRAIESKHISILEVSDAARRILSRELLASDSVEVSFEISIIVEHFGYSPEEAAEAMSSLIEVASSGSTALENAINARLSALRGSSFTPISISGVIVLVDDATMTPIRTASPTPAPSGLSRQNSSRGGKGLLLTATALYSIIAVGIMVSLVCLGIFGSNYMRSRRGKGMNTSVDSPRTWTTIQVNTATDICVNREITNLDELRHRSVRLEPQPASPITSGKLLGYFSEMVFQKRVAPIEPPPDGAVVAAQAPLTVASFDAYESPRGNASGGSALLREEDVECGSRGVAL